MLPETIGRSVCYHYSTLLQFGPHDFCWSSRQQLVPLTTKADFPFSQKDGDGLFFPPQTGAKQIEAQPDIFQLLRHSWIQHIIHNPLDQALLQHIGSDNPNPPFSDEVLQPFRHDLEQFLRAHDETPDWTMSEHQPMQLNILDSISKTMGDRRHLTFPSLQAGVKTVSKRDIPLSAFFLHKLQRTWLITHLSIHMQNWQSAESDLELTQSLVNEELEKGWVSNIQAP